MFEKATRMALRFETPKGLLTTEDLWRLNLADLNQLAKALNRKIRESEEEDFLAEGNSANQRLHLEFKVVLHILNTKKAERDRRASAAEKKQEKDRLLEVLQRKQQAALEDLTEEEIQAKINAL